MTVFVKLIKDSNMNVYDEVIKAIGVLAKGLKSSFSEQAKALIQPILANIKKKPSTIQIVVQTLENILLWVDFADVFPSIKELLKDKNAAVVKQSCDFMQAAMKKMFKEDLIKMTDTVCSDLIKLSNHNDGDLRELGLSTLGLLKIWIGTGIDKYLKDFNQQKQSKVTDAEAEFIKNGVKFKERPKAKKPAAKPKADTKKVDDDGDAIMTDDAMPPKKGKGGPPSSFLERQQKMKI